MEEKKSPNQSLSSGIVHMPMHKKPSLSKSIPLYSPEFYAACSLGGILSCGSTHFLMTPIDLVKCRRQINPSIYSSLVNGISSVWRQNGLRGMWGGGVPTLLGYSAQGACKFGFYEFFKHFYAGAFGQEQAHKYRTALYLAASASAEMIADVALCPMEAVKVKMQTSSTSYAATFRAAVKRLYAAEGIFGFYKGLTPLWMRQVPYTMMKFAAFERTVEAIYGLILGKPKASFNKAQQLGVTFAAGYWAGIFCAVVSHPADTVVSKLNNSHATSIGAVLKELGLKGVWRGLSSRIFMIGTLTALQWFIYDTFKVYAGLPTSGASTLEDKTSPKSH